MTIHRCRSPRLSLAAACMPLLLMGCASLLPDAQRLKVQQGKVLDAATINALERGQSRGRVRELLGDPVLTTPFHEKRWDYVYYRTQSGKEVAPQRLTLYFDNSGLTRIVDRYSTPDNPMPAVPGGRLPDVERPARSQGGPSSPAPGPGGPSPAPQSSP